MNPLYAERLEHYRRVLPGHVFVSAGQEVLWGHGAMLIRNPSGPCDDCGRVMKPKEVEHVFHDLTTRCVGCARVWVGLDETPDQGSLAV